MTFNDGFFKYFQGNDQNLSDFKKCYLIFIVIVNFFLFLQSGLKNESYHIILYDSYTAPGCINYAA